MYAIIDTENGGRMHGFSKVEVSTNNPRFDVIETSESTLKSVFEDAKSSGETLDGPDESIDAAIDDPLAFRDFLILVDGAIEFDSDYVRETPDGTSA